MLSVNYSFHLNLPYGIHSMSTVRFKVLHFIHTFPCEICMPSYYRGTRFFEITRLTHFCFDLNLILNLAKHDKQRWLDKLSSSLPFEELHTLPPFTFRLQTLLISHNKLSQYFYLWVTSPLLFW